MHFSWLGQVIYNVSLGEKKIKIKSNQNIDLENLTLKRCKPVVLILFS